MDGNTCSKQKWLKKLATNLQHQQYAKAHNVNGAISKRIQDKPDRNKRSEYKKYSGIRLNQWKNSQQQKNQIHYNTI